jgi:NADH-quinone oxidoreductase subunit L
VALLTAFLTALYMTRAVLLTFFGRYRGDAHPHESPRSMTYPMIVLAVLSIGAGWVGIPASTGFRAWTELPFGIPAEAEPFSIALALLSVVLAALGILLGFSLYRSYRERDPVLQLGPLTTLLVNKYYLDDLYLKGIVRPIQYGISAAVYWTNQNILDGVVNGAAWLARKAGLGVNEIDRRIVDGAVNGVALGARWSGSELKNLQTGRVQSYALYLFGGVALLAVVIVVIR